MLKIIFLSLFLLIIPIGNAQTALEKNSVRGDFMTLNGINMYYEIYGSGKPLVLIHGNGGSVAGHSKKIQFFKENFKVITMDTRGHGKTTGNNGKPLTYLQMAEDVNILMDSLNIKDAYVWGQSDGGIIGLLLAIQHPEKIDRLAIFGANLFPGPKAVQEPIVEFVNQTLSTTTDPKIKQLFSLLVLQPNISEEQLHQINSPVLIMTGDRDAIKLEHSIKIFRNIPNSNLFVMPGATHFGSYEKPELFNQVLLDFFTKPFSKTSTIEKLLPNIVEDTPERSPSHK